MDDWVLMAEDVEKHYANFDGFVILHGTDTMAFTSSALAFMLKDTKKGIVITGKCRGFYYNMLLFIINFNYLKGLKYRCSSYVQMLNRTSKEL